MSIIVTYDVSYREDATPDEIVRMLRGGYANFAVDRSPEHLPEVTYTRKIGAVPPTLAMTVTAEPDHLMLTHRGAAGLMMLLGGTNFRDPKILRVVLTDVYLREDPGGFPGPLLGRSLLSSPADGGPWLSVPLPKSLPRDAFADVCSALIQGGVRVVNDLRIDLTAVEQLERAEIIAGEIDKLPQQRAALFFNGTAKLSYALDLAGLIETRLRAVSPNLVVGMRICPVSVGYSVLELLRQRTIPIFAYTVAPIPSGDIAWTTSAYASLMNIFGADVVNIGLLSRTLFEKGTLLESILSLSRRRESGFPSLPALTGGVTPEVAYDYGTTLDAPYLLHTMTPVFSGGLAAEAIRRRVEAILEAVSAGGERLEPDRLFAMRDPRVRSWQSLREA